MSTPALTPVPRRGDPRCGCQEAPGTLTCDMPGTGWALGTPSHCTIPPNTPPEADHD